MSRAQLTSTVEQNTGGAVSPYVGAKNFLANGGFDFWQRGTSFSSAASIYTTVYSADRWYFVSNYTGSSAAYTLTRQSAGVAGFQYAAKIQRTSGQTATGSIQLQQSMETATSIPLAGKTVTLSFYAKAGANYSATSNLLVVRLFTGTGTDENVQTGYAGFQTQLDTTATLTTTMQRFSYQVAIPSTATEIGLVFLSNPTGTAGADDSFYITGVQLEVGSVATPFSRAGGTLQGELSLCQRYFWQISSANIDRVAAQAISSTRAFGPLLLPVTMRTAPSYSFAAASNFGLINSSGGVLTCTTVSIAAQATNMVTLDFTSSGGGLTAGNATACWFQSTSSTIALSAEL